MRLSNVFVVLAIFVGFATIHHAQAFGHRSSGGSGSSSESSSTGGSGGSGAGKIPGGGGGGAPEPVSMILLAAGGGVAGVKYLKRRKSDKDGASLKS
jgi:hypothetical protein